MDKQEPKELTTPSDEHSTDNPDSSPIAEKVDLKDLLQDLSNPESKVTRETFLSIMGSFGPREPEFVKKLDGSHLTQIIEAAREETQSEINDRGKERGSNRITLIIILIFVLFFIYIVFYFITDDQYRITMVSSIVSLVAGFLGGYGYSSLKIKK